MVNNDTKLTDAGAVLNLSTYYLSVISAWTPYVRNNGFAAMRHVNVYFGNVMQVTRIDVQQNTALPHQVTEITVEYTNDGVSYYGMEKVNHVWENTYFK